MRQRHHDRQDTTPPRPATDPADDPLRAAHETAERFLDAADAAIDRVVARDEHAYLSSVPQVGGQ